VACRRRDRHHPPGLYDECHRAALPRAAAGVLNLLVCGFSLSHCEYRLSQKLNTKRPIVVKLCGVLVQGTHSHNGFFVFLHVHGVRKDADSVSTLLWELMAWCREPQIKRVVLIVDNAGGEGKNETVLATLSAAVWYDWFEHASMRNLFPGHAHSYLDALFSHVQRALRWRTICSLADVADTISHALRKEPLRPTVGVLERAVGWSRYFASALNSIHGHSGPLQFNIFREQSAEAPARMLTRTDTDHEWEGLDKGPQAIDLLRVLPRGHPQLLPLRQYNESDADAIEQTIKSAENRKLPLIHAPEAEALRKILSTGSSGVVMQAPQTDDGGVGVAGQLFWPGTANSINVRVIGRVPRTLQAPSRSSMQGAAPAGPASAKPAVPLFHRPRESAISHSATRAKELREQAVIEAERKSAAPAASSAAAATSASAAASAASAAAPAPARSRSRTQPSTPTRRSPRSTPSPSPNSSRGSGRMVGWDQIDDD
jgi:hypothetical protein